MIYDMWPTPLGVYEIGDDYLNQQLLEAMKSQSTQSTKDNLWDLQNNAYTELGNRMLSCANLVIKKRPMPVTLSLGRAWVKCHNLGDIQTPHAHSRNLLVGVYYIQAHEGSGDLLLQDPNAGSGWHDAVDNGENCRSYIRVKPKAGVAVFFPGYVVHSVEPNRSNAQRICVSTNFYDNL